jgi:hypothetical protein
MSTWADIVKKNTVKNKTVRVRWTVWNSDPNISGKEENTTSCSIEVGTPRWTVWNSNSNISGREENTTTTTDKVFISTEVVGCVKILPTKVLCLQMLPYDMVMHIFDFVYGDIVKNNSVQFRTVLTDLIYIYFKFDGVSLTRLLKRSSPHLLAMLFKEEREYIVTNNLNTGFIYENPLMQFWIDEKKRRVEIVKDKYTKLFATWIKKEETISLRVTELDEMCGDECETRWFNHYDHCTNSCPRFARGVYKNMCLRFVDNACFDYSCSHIQEKYCIKDEVETFYEYPVMKLETELRRLENLVRYEEAVKGGYIMEYERKLDEEFMDYYDGYSF